MWEKIKWSLTRHVNRIKKDQRTSHATTWRDYDKKRRQGRPTKWRGDDMDNHYMSTTDLAEREQRKAGYFEVAFWGFNPTTWHYDWPMMMPMKLMLRAQSQTAYMCRGDIIPILPCKLLRCRPPTESPIIASVALNTTSLLVLCVLLSNCTRDTALGQRHFHYRA